MATLKKKRRPGLRGLPGVTPYTPAAERLDNLKVDVFKAGLYAAGAGLAIGAVLFAKSSIHKSVEEAKKEKALDQVTTLFTPSYYADRLQAAFNPSGFTSLSLMDGTDVTGVMNVARLLTSQAQLVQVAVAYRTLTKTPLSDDLRDELNPAEYQTFWNIIRKKPLK